MVLSFIWGAPVSLIIGWVIYKFSLASRRNAIIEQFEGLPADYFGLVSVSMDHDGLAIQAPHFQGKYDWKMINTIKMTQEYLFFCFNTHLVLSIPISALGTQQSEFIEKADNWMSSAKQPLMSSTKV
jgi:hypothetical protein